MTVSACTNSSSKEAFLLQTLLNLASPRTARYLGHVLRNDNSYRVVVQSADSFRTLTILAPVLSLVEAGILVERDRACVLEQLN